LTIDNGAIAFLMDETAGYGVVSGANAEIDVTGTGTNVFNIAIAAGI
jgi:hypothetical protein